MPVIDTRPSDESSLVLHSIGAVERSSGLSKDTLRVWERRYGFPRPQRDEHGERVYRSDDIEKLRLIKRLIDRGYRPGKIVDLPAADLRTLTETLGEDDTPPGLQRLIDALKGHRAAELHSHLAQLMVRDGLDRFILNTVAPLNYHVGVAWMKGQIEVHEEHVYTEMIQSLLRGAVGSLPASERAPTVLLTTFPNELHSLGILMVQALLGGKGANCISLGTQTPIEDIVAAAKGHQADVVALSFSAAFPTGHLLDGLSELRERLPPRVDLWVGGGHPALTRRNIDGLTVVTRLDEVGALLEAWRATHRAR